MLDVGLNPVNSTEIIIPASGMLNGTPYNPQEKQHLAHSLIL